MNKKKILVKTVFDNTKKILPRGSKSSVASYLSSEFEQKFKYSKDERTFVRFYTALVENNSDYDIDDVTLDWFSEYIGYKDYKDFCKNATFTKTTGDSTTVKVSINDDEESIAEKFSKIFITVTNNPIFNLPEFLTKQSNLGILGVILCGSFVVGSKLYKADDGTPEIIDNGSKLGLLSGQKQCMYWNGKEYIPEYCNDTKNDLIAIDPKKVANFKKITTPDTIKSVKGIWYSKYQNEVEFFTADGINPDNGKELKSLTEGILNKYGN